MEVQYEEIGTECVDSGSPPLRYVLPNGKGVYIAAPDQDFFKKLQQLPAPTKIEMMKLSIEDLQTAIDGQKALLISALGLCFGSRWRCRYEDVRLSFTDPVLNEIRFGLKMTGQQIIKNATSGKLDVLTISEPIFTFFREEANPNLIKGKAKQFDSDHFKLIMNRL